MKDEGLFERLASIENLLLAWELFRKGKRKREDVMLFERRLEDNLFEIRDELVSDCYRHCPYERFVIHDPKQRTIHKALVRDRIVHQAIVNVIESAFEKHFIYDSYSCRVGKGTHAAVKRLRKFLRSHSVNNTRIVYALKCDVRKFFDSVDHSVLLGLLRQRIHNIQTMTLSDSLIESFEVSSGKGIPLGNLTSQLFANVYLHELDLYVKQHLRVRHYIRYCDDFVILVDTPSEATELKRKIQAFLQSRLKLNLHPNKMSVRTWKQGIDFLGYVLLPHAVILRPKTAKRAILRADEMNVASYLGLCAHAEQYDLERFIRNKVGKPNG